MARFLVIYRAGTSAQEQLAKATPEQMRAGMDAWMAWAKSCGDALVDMGAPLGRGVRVESRSHDPLAADAVGYSMLEAGSLEDAATLVDGHPHLHLPDGRIDVIEALPTPGT